MKCPCEIIVWDVLPCIRAALAAELVEKGLSQNEISKMLGITQAAVSQYRGCPTIQNPSKKKTR